MRVPAVGLRPAILEFLIANEDWDVVHHYRNNNGLTVLARRGNATVEPYDEGEGTSRPRLWPSGGWRYGLFGALLLLAVVALMHAQFDRDRARRLIKP